MLRVTGGPLLGSRRCGSIAAVTAAADTLACWVALSQVPRLGAARFRMLEAHFEGDLTRAWSASTRELRAAGIGGAAAQGIAAARSATSPDAELERLAQYGVTALTWQDAGYPPRLKETPDPPPVLYLMGNLRPDDETAVAVVGTRRPTDYGRRATDGLCAGLAERGITVVSGLALGIDTCAHTATLRAGGRTVAVLGNGLDMIYPAENGRLAQRIIAAGGAIVSEFALGVRPEASNFPRRNRIISGMTLGTLVTEASETSGTRWTVYHALEQNREIFCVPGSIYSPASKLTNRLIREGAKLVCEVGDILTELGLDDAAHQIPLGLADTSSENDGENDGESDGENGGLENAGPESVGLDSVGMENTGLENAGNDGGGVDRKGSDMLNVAVAERTPAEAVDADEAAVLRQVTAEPIHIDDIVRAVGRPVSEVSSRLTMLELKGLIMAAGAMHYQRVG